MAGGSGSSSIIIVLDTELKGARSRSRKQAFPDCGLDAEESSQRAASGRAPR